MMDPSACWSAMLNYIKTRFSVQNSDGIFSLVGGFALHLTLGTLYCFGNLNTYITSYIRIHVHEGIMYSDMIWIPTLATIAQVLFGYESYVMDPAIFQHLPFIVLIAYYSLEGIIYDI